MIIIEKEDRFMIDILGVMMKGTADMMATVIQGTGDRVILKEDMMMVMEVTDQA